MAYKQVKISKFDLKNETGEKYTCSLKVQLDMESGGFRIQVPNDLYSILDASEIELSSPRGVKEKYSYAYGDSLKKVESIIREGITNKLQCKIERDIVIVYKFMNRSRYYKLNDGTIKPNAEGVEGYEQGGTGKWVGGEGVSSFDDVEGMGINIFVDVLEQVRYIRPNGTSAEYNSYCHRVNTDGKYGIGESNVDCLLAEELTSYLMNGSSIDDLNCYHKTDINENTGEYNIVLYSDENAAFFINMLSGLYKLADRFNEFFKQDTVELVESIKNNQKLLE